MIQNLLDGILVGSILSLGAIGLTMAMHMLRFANFSHAELLSIGAYAALVFDGLFAALLPATCHRHRPAQPDLGAVAGDPCLDGDHGAIRRSDRPARLSPCPRQGGRVVDGLRLASAWR